MRREERVTVQGPVKEQQPDGMSHRRGAYVGGRSDAVTWDGATKGSTKFSMVSCALVLLKTMPVRQESSSVSRKQSAASKNQYNMSNTTPASQVPASKWMHISA